MAKSAAARKQTLITEPEPYMAAKHVVEFRAVLESMLKECDQESILAMRFLREESERPADGADQCDISIEREEKRHLADRLAKRRLEIDAAIRRLNAGDYGYCEETGDEIGLPRLRANPLARLCIEAATRQEYLAKVRAH